MFFIGHKTQWHFLVQVARNQMVPQAMIFSGQEKLGKKKISLEFIKLLNCQNIQFQGNKIGGEQIIPCQHCLPCRVIEKRQSPNLIFLKPEGKEIQIGQIRDLQKMLMLKSSLCRFKAAIIDQAESLNSEAQNCLLKSLEEPKGNVLLILIASQIEKLLPTIRSRCQALKFFPLSFSEILEGLKNKAPEPELKKFFFLSQGRPGLMIDFLTIPEKFSQCFKSLQEAEKILSSELFEKFIFIPKFFGKEISLEQIGEFLSGLENYLRLILLKKTGLSNEILDLFNPKTAENYSCQKLKENLENIRSLKNLIFETNVNLKLALENLFIDLS